MPALHSVLLPGTHAAAAVPTTVTYCSIRVTCLFLHMLIVRHRACIFDLPAHALPATVPPIPIFPPQVGSILYSPAVMGAAASCFTLGAAV